MLKNIKLFKRLNKLGLLIRNSLDTDFSVKTDDDDYRNLDLIYFLLNEHGENKDSKGFWDAFVHFYAKYNEYHHSLTINQVIKILELADTYNNKVRTDESKQLLDSLREFISSNGLLSKARSTNHFWETGFIEDEVSNLYFNVWDYLATENITEGDIDKTSMKYKNTLKDALLLVHNIYSETERPDGPIGLPPNKKELALLEKHQLVKDLQKNVIEDNPEPKPVIPLMEIYQSDMDDPEDYMDSIEALPLYFLNFESVLSRLIDFKGLLTHYSIGDLGKYPSVNKNLDIFSEYLRNYDCGIEPEKILQSINYLIRHLTAKAMLESGEPDIELKDLALIAGLKTYQTIHNDLSSKSKDKKKDDKRAKLKRVKKPGKKAIKVTHDSAKLWLMDTIRKHPMQKPMFSFMYADDITLELINTISD